MEHPEKEDVKEESLEFNLTEFLKIYSMELRDEEKDFDISKELFNHRLQEFCQWLEKL